MTRIFIEVDDLEDTVRRIANDPRLPTIDVGAVISSVLDLMFYQPAYDDEQICEFLLQFGIISDRFGPINLQATIRVHVGGEHQRHGKRVHGYTLRKALAGKCRHPNRSQGKSQRY
jgi:hypothetical protein